jgi:MinD-like ATPase involved in chromosome partitioning or flagellar assembly
VQQCVNRGEPVVLSEPRSEFSRGLQALAKQVAPQATTPRSAQKRKRTLSFARA